MDVEVTEQEEEILREMEIEPGEIFKKTAELTDAVSTRQIVTKQSFKLYAIVFVTTGHLEYRKPYKPLLYSFNTLWHLSIYWVIYQCKVLSNMK